jgi:hypothetical protein
MIINQIAHMIFDSFQDTGIVLAILNRNKSYVSNKLEIFEKVFTEQKLLESLCCKIDDGCEPLMTQIGEYLVAAESLGDIGYVVILLPRCDFKESSEYLGLIEIILEQFSVLAGLVEQNQQLRDYGEYVKPNSDLAVFANVN